MNTLIALLFVNICLTKCKASPSEVIQDQTVTLDDFWNFYKNKFGLRIEKPKCNRTWTETLLRASYQLKNSYDKEQPEPVIIDDTEGTNDSENSERLGDVVEKKPNKKYKE